MPATPLPMINHVYIMSILSVESNSLYKTGRCEESMRKKLLSKAWIKKIVNFNTKYYEPRKF